MIGRCLIYAKSLFHIAIAIHSYHFVNKSIGQRAYKFLKYFPKCLCQNPKFSSFSTKLKLSICFFAFFSTRMVTLHINNVLKTGYRQKLCIYVLFSSSNTSSKYSVKISICKNHRNCIGQDIICFI